MQQSILNHNEALTEIADITQSIYLILSTIKGSDPLRPTFGSDAYMYLDKPMNDVQPMLVYEIYQAVEQWEKRIFLNSVRVINTAFDKKAINITATIKSENIQFDTSLNIFDINNDNNNNDFNDDFNDDF